MKLRYYSLVVASILLYTPIMADDVESVDQGKSFDGQLQVVNIRDGRGGYFEIRTPSGDVLFSEKTIEDRYVVPPKRALQVLWSADSQWVAIAFGTTKFSVETVVLHRRGTTLEMVEVPAYDVDSENTHRVPQEWIKNGDLVLAISTGYQTKSDGAIHQYLATIHFAGIPPKGVRGSQTKSKPLDDKDNS